MARALLLLLGGLLLAAPARADDAARAGELQRDALEALEAGDDTAALRLAEDAILLNAGPATWLARQVQIEALERLGRIDDALEALQGYMALDGLFPEHVAWGREVRGRLEGRRIVADAEAQRAGEQARIRRGLGVGLLVGGAAPTVVGVGFLANYGRLGGDPARYGGWGEAGGGLLAAGLAVEAVGVILLASSGGAAPVAVAPLPLQGGGGVVVSLRLPTRAQRLASPLRRPRSSWRSDATRPPSTSAPSGRRGGVRRAAPVPPVRQQARLPLRSGEALPPRQAARAGRHAGDRPGDPSGRDQAARGRLPADPARASTTR